MVDSNKLPNWARWVALDRDGKWWCYEAEPHRHDYGWYENEVGRSEPVGDGQEPSECDWEQSLRKLNQ